MLRHPFAPRKCFSGMLVQFTESAHSRFTTLGENDCDEFLRPFFSVGGFRGGFFGASFLGGGPKMGDPDCEDLMNVKI